MSKQNKQTEYNNLYNKFEKAFWDMFKYAEKNKKGIESIEGSEHLVEAIDEWAVGFEGCIDLAKENSKLRQKLGID